MTELRKRETWVDDLEKYVKSKAKESFQWGLNDCVLFACEAIEVMTGVYPISEIAGSYRTRKGAVGTLHSFLSSSLEDACEKIADEVGAREIHPALAKMGDLVLTKHGKFRQTLCVCFGEKLLAPSKKGLAIIAHDKAVCAWRILS